MKKDIWAICLDEELDMNQDYWVIANEYASKKEALAATSLPQREAFRDLKKKYHSVKLKSDTYAVEGVFMDGGVYELTRKEVS